MGPGDNPDAAISMAIDPAGMIAVGGFADTGGFIFDLALARYNAEGSLDTTFGASGKALTNVGPGNTDEDLWGLGPADRQDPRRWEHRSHRVRRRQRLPFAC